MEHDRFCATCGKRLEESVSKHATTHPGTCRDENTQSLLKKHNLQVKIDKIRSILVFLEERFALDIDIDLLTDILSKINMYHATTEDFVMTAYYLMSSESNAGVTIRDITEAAYTLDGRNDRRRSDSSKRRILDHIRLLGKYLDVTEFKIIMDSPTWRDDLQRLLSRMKPNIYAYWKKSSTTNNGRIQYVNTIVTKIRSVINQKFGYNKNAYKTLKGHIDVVVRDIDERIPSVISSMTAKLLIDQVHVTEMMDVYSSAKRRLIGRDASVIVGGIVYHISQKYGLGLSQEIISTATRTSVPSIRKIYKILNDMDDGTHGTNER